MWIRSNRHPTNHQCVCRSFVSRVIPRSCWHRSSFSPALFCWAVLFPPSGSEPARALTPVATIAQATAVVVEPAQLASPVPTLLPTDVVLPSTDQQPYPPPAATLPVTAFSPTPEPTPAIAFSPTPELPIPTVASEGAGIAPTAPLAQAPTLEPTLPPPPVVQPTPEPPAPTQPVETQPPAANPQTACAAPYPSSAYRDPSADRHHPNHNLLDACPESDHATTRYTGGIRRRSDHRTGR